MVPNCILSSQKIFGLVVSLQKLATKDFELVNHQKFLGQNLPSQQKL